MKSFLFLFSIFILGLGNAKAADPQYYWVTPDKVYLWVAADDPQPLVATRNANGQWTRDREETSDQWRETLRTVVGKARPAEVNKFSDPELWQGFLEKLREEFSPMWATPRQISAAIHLRNKDAQTVEVEVIWTEGSVDKYYIYIFRLGADGVWKKSEDIPLDRIFGVGLGSNALRNIFDLPSQAPLPAGTAGWTQMWDRWINDFLVGESIRPVMYLDDARRWRWLWRERHERTAELPRSFRKMAEKGSTTTVDSSPTPAKGGGGGGILPEWNIVTFVLIGLVIAVAVGLFIRRRSIIDYARPRLLKVLGAPEGRDWFSKDAITALHEATKAEHAKALVPSEKNRELLFAFMLDWVHKEYLNVLDSPAFAGRAKDLETQIIDKYKADLGLSEVSDSVLKKKLSLGSASEEAVKRIPNLLSLPAVTKALNPEKLDLQSDEAWLTNWPIVMESLAEQLVSFESRFESVKGELSDVKTRHEGAVNERAKQLEATYGTQIKELTSDLDMTKKDRDTVTNELTRANGELSQLTQMLKDSEAAKNYLGVLQKQKDDIQEVQKLSKYLRQLVQGFLSQQQRFAEAERLQPELRPVALLMSLVNFSLLQLCFSITGENPLLRKGMAHNILALGPLLGPAWKRAEFLGTLRRIEEGVDEAITDLKDLGEYVPDAQLFRTFLTRLKTDMATDPGTFFVDIDSKDGKIVPVS